MRKPITIADGRVRVIYNPGMPSEIRELLQPILAKWGWVLPPTCDELRVEFHAVPTQDVEPETQAAVELNSEYRLTSLYVFGKWLEHGTEEREATIVHELAHILAAPLTEFADDLVERTCTDPTLKGWAKEQNRRACEATVCDITEALMRKHTKGAR